MSVRRYSWRSLKNASELHPTWLNSRKYSERTSPRSPTPGVCEDPFGAAAKFSEIIDVRTADEYSLDHIPGAINLPILDKDQRQSVGVLYGQNRFDARKLGAKIISQNISDYLSDHFQEKPPEYSPLVYCWRGGQRSLSLSLVLSQIGFDVSVLSGGYRAYRKQVRQHLVQLPQQLQFNVISGLTGSGKTRLLQELRLRGEQVVDLEELANHRGSVLGIFPGEEQPPQKYMESLLVQKLLDLDPTRTVWVESESKKIGLRSIPDDLFARMCLAKRVYSLELPIEARVNNILSNYSPWMENKESLKVILWPLWKYHGLETVQKWSELIDSNCWPELVKDLLEKHYDKTYSRSQKQMFRRNGNLETLSIPDLSSDTLSRIVTSVITKNF